MKMHVRFVLSLALVGLCTSARDAHAALPDCTPASIRAAVPAARAPVVDRALAWVRDGVPTCHCLDARSDPYRADDGGLVSMAWRLPPPGHARHQFAGGVWADHLSTTTTRDALVPGDALHRVGDPLVGDGQLLLFAGWRDDAHTRLCAIEMLEGDSATIRERFVDDAFVPVQPTSLDQSLQARCEGDVFVTAGGRTDCSVVGARCIDDALSARCVLEGCAATGEGHTCLSTGRRATCVNGSYASVADCGVDGEQCIADALGARCVSPACPTTGSSEVCFAGGRVGACSDGTLTPIRDCTTSQQRCQHIGGHATCTSTTCPASGDVTFCSDLRHVRRCVNGAVVFEGDCGAFAGHCTEHPDGSSASCLSDFCVGVDVEQAPVDVDRCFFFVDRAVVHCRADGSNTREECGAGRSCDVDGVTPHCADNVCPEAFIGTRCDGRARVRHCDNGDALAYDDCAARGGACLDDDAGARCIDAICTSDPAATAPAHDVCLPDGRVAHCTSDGAIDGVTTCDEGRQCAQDGGVVRCAITSVVDAGTPDARDAGVVDPHADAGSSSSPPRPHGCASVDGSAGGEPAALWAVLGSLLALRRRRPRVVVSASRAQRRGSRRRCRSGRRRRR